MIGAEFCRLTPDPAPPIVAAVGQIPMKWIADPANHFRDGKTTDGRCRDYCQGGEVNRYERRGWLCDPDAGSPGRALVFRGQYQHSIDAKGRVSLPAKFRETLAELDITASANDRIILTQTFHQCLVAYPYDRWLRFEEKIRQLPQFDPNVIRLKRVYVAGAIECTLDGHGRLLVPQAMRDFASLEGQVVWVGQLDTIELWSSDRWQDATNNALQDPKALADAMAQFGL